MKKTLFIIGTIMILLLPKLVTAEVGSSSAGVDEKAINNFIDKLATKSAEIVKDKNNKAISGFITDIKPEAITIKNEIDDIYTVKPDEALTKYYQVAGASRKEIKLDDLKKGKFIIIAGVLNDKNITANSIYVDEMFLVKSGKVTNVDKDDYTLKVMTTEKDSYTISIEVTTKQQMVNVKTTEEESTGFSKIKEGDTIHFVAKKTGGGNLPTGGNTYSATKILIIPQEYFMK